MAGLVDFTNPEEVKEYLENIEIENIFGCHKKNDPDSCERLGDLYLMLKQYKNSATNYKMCCENYRHPGCCEKAGDCHILGKGSLKKDHEEAFRCYRTGCYQDSYEDVGLVDKMGTNCWKMGNLLRKFKKSGKDVLNLPDLNTDSKVHPKMDNPPATLVDIYLRSCELRERDGCGQLSDLYRTGLSGECEKNNELAIKYGDLGCKMGNYRSCHNLAVMFYKGVEVPKNMEKAKEYAIKAQELASGNAQLQMGSK